MSIINCKVVHKTFGFGVIINREKNVILVHFPHSINSDKNVNFSFPSAFTQGFLVPADDLSTRCLANAISQTKDENQVQRVIPKTFAPTELIDEDGSIYHKYTGRILNVDHWANRGFSSFERYRQMKYGRTTFHYTGKSGFYRASLDYRGPRLDIQIDLNDCTFFKRPIEVNIYTEVMDILKYKRMSPKLYRSFEVHRGKNIDIFISDDDHLWVDVRPLFCLNYGYLYL